MKKSKPTKLLLGFLGIATFASLVGTVSGTLAWYAYSTRATLSYSGTSVNNTVQLQIGIASPSKVASVQEIQAQNAQIIADNPDITDEEREELSHLEDLFVDFWNEMEETKWDNDSNYYYFAPVGSGLTSPIINAYLKSNGYATNSLAPVTSGSFARGDSFSLKTSPNPDPNHSLRPADKKYYATIPFVFRVIRSNTTTPNNYVGGSELWLNDAAVRASSDADGEIFSAIRLFIDRDNTMLKNATDLEPYYKDDFILNPSASTSGSTIVGGLLDLTRDNYYDYDENDNEIIYGEYESVGGIQPSYTGADEIADINGTGKTGDNYDTFTAKHRPGINYYIDYNNCVFKTADYEALSTIMPLKDEVTGVLHNRDAANPTSVCITKGAEGHYLGRVDFTIYLEGWDHSVVDEEIEHYFDLGLTFEINKLGA